MEYVGRRLGYRSTTGARVAPKWFQGRSTPWRGETKSPAERGSSRELLGQDSNLQPSG
jgi:hypothetical protein